MIKPAQATASVARLLRGHSLREPAAASGPPSLVPAHAMPVSEKGAVFTPLRRVISGDGRATLSDLVSMGGIRIRARRARASGRPDALDLLLSVLPWPSFCFGVSE